MTELDFRRLVEEAQKQNPSLVVAIYRVNDQLTREANKAREAPWACHKGCSYCCNQLVCATEPEWQEIERFFQSVRDPKLRDQLKRRLKPRRKEWSNWVAGHRLMFRTNDPKSTLETYEAWRGKPCVFLGDEGGCLIYPARPIDCRTAFSTVECGTEAAQNGGAIRLPYEWHGWANNTILDEAKKLAGQGPIVLAPLPYWLEWLALLR